MPATVSLEHESGKERHSVIKAAKAYVCLLKGQLYDRHASRLPQHDSLHASSVTGCVYVRALGGKAMAMFI